MTTKNVKSRLFKGSPDQLLLDERVSKIVLPTLEEDRAVMDEKEGNWGLSPIEDDETEVTETLQIFIGLPEKKTETTWEISEDDNPFWDEEDAELDEVPVPMSLSLNPSAIISETNNQNEQEEVTSGLPPGLSLQSIQEIHDDEPVPQLEESDEWGQIAWDDVTLSDILGDFDNEEIDDDPAGAQIVFETTVATGSNAASEEVFPALVSLEDIPTWEESWEQDETDPIGPELNFSETTSPDVALNDEWFDDLPDPEIADQHDVQSLPVSNMPSYTNSHRPPPPRIVLKQSVGFWNDPFVQVWLMILSIALIAAMIWRILQMV